MTTGGLWMLLALAALVVATGLPVWALLVGVSGLGALLGVATGSFDAAVLSALPGRILNLLDNDLLQAMPLYVFIGVLLAHLPLAGALHGSLAWQLRGSGAGPGLATLGVGALVAPMNGSVASSAALLGRLVRTAPDGDAAGRTALVAAGATIGVVVPPSLVLLLLGDAMLRAHTEATRLPGYAGQGERIVNTQDILQAALLPALALLVLWVVATWWSARGTAAPSAPPRRRDRALALGTAAAILLLLAGVFTGRLLAVEAAATGGCLLGGATLVARALTRAQWREVLHDTLTLSGALFALLAGATTFSLVVRLFGTDRWVADLVLGSPWPAHATALAVLAGVLACACVLDAFELVFVVVPVVAPPLVVQLGDARQAAVLLLLVLQLGFLLPPLGYAVLMARAQATSSPGWGALLARLAPFIAAQLLVLGAVFAWPAAVHVLDRNAALQADDGTPRPSEDEIVRQMEEMGRQAPAAEAPADAASR